MRWAGLCVSVDMDSSRFSPRVQVFCCKEQWLVNSRVIIARGGVASADVHRAPVCERGSFST